MRINGETPDGTKVVTSWQRSMIQADRQMSMGGEFHNSGAKTKKALSQVATHLTSRGWSIQRMTLENDCSNWACDLGSWWHQLFPGEYMTPGLGSCYSNYFVMSQSTQNLFLYLHIYNLHFPSMGTQSNLLHHSPSLSFIVTTTPGRVAHLQVVSETKTTK